MREHRVNVQELKLGVLDVTCMHPELGSLEGIAEDVSTHGLSLVSNHEHKLHGLMLGDRVESVTVGSDAGILYEGRGLIRRVTERGASLVIGLELDAAGLDVARMSRSGNRRDFARRWEALGSRRSSIVPEFKSWLLDLRSALVATQEFLAAEERALASHDRRTRREAETDYLAVVTADLRRLFEQASRDLARIVAGFSDGEHFDHRAYCMLHLAPLLVHSPFLRRAREKPLGYAGDYEMMNMLYGDPAEGETLFGRALNLCFTHEPAAVANKNRVSYLGARIRQALAEHPNQRVRIASLGCGPAREIEVLLGSSPELGPRLEIALIDQEERAIAHCERTLTPLAAATGARVQYICDGLRSLLTRESLSAKLGPRELIYSAGLFDYLHPRMFTRISSALFEALTPGGLLAIGNVAAGNPSRWVMEYFSEWFLIHRSTDELLALAAEVQPRPAQATVDAEPLGINLFLLLRR